MAANKLLIAFFGATGGSILATLVLALKAGYDCTALARTPSKLTALLTKNGVPQSVLDTHLSISTGDVFNADDCKKPLTLNGRTADIVISGIGSYSITSEITVCTTLANNALSALRTLPHPTSGKQPLFIALSTTGVSDGPRDFPLLMAPIYHLVLVNPHRDKKMMEKAIVEQTERFVIVRPSALTNGKATQGIEKVRVGTEERPAVGYLISREEVGLWIFEELVKGDGGRYVGQKVTITH